MALSFPINPTLGQTYTFGNKTWVWTGSAWKIQDVGAINGITIGNTTPAAGTFSDLTVTTTTDLGNVANITILGGTSGQVLSTDGTGNLSWADGGTGPGSATTIAVDNFAGDGETATFTLSVTPTNKDWITVNINGVLQLEDAYEVSGTTLTLDSAPPSGVSIDVRTVRFGSEFTLGNTTVVAVDNFVGDGEETDFELSATPATKDWITVNLNGVIQQSADYTLLGNVLTFITAPPDSAKLEIRTVQFGANLTVPSTLAVSSEGTLEVGNVTGLNFTGSGVTVTGSGATATIDIDTSTANTAVTVTGNAQGNITSVGTLTGLNVAGNVGIGTSSPGSRLTVASPETTSITAETINNPVAVALSATYMDSGGYGYGSVGTTTNHGFEFQQNGIPRMILTPTGNIGVLNANVGINQFAPAELLDVGGNVRAQGFVGAGPLNLSAAGTNIITASTNSTERVRIDSAGNVGIGTSSPAAALDVVSLASNAQGLRIRGRASDSIGGLVYTDNNGTTQRGFIQSRGDNEMRYFAGTGSADGVQTFYTANTERMRITSTGNVGIGTSSPAVKLEVVGDAMRLSDSSGNGTYQGRFASGRCIFSGGIAGVTDSGAVIARGSSAAFNAFGLELWAGGTERLRIDSSGNLGLGVTPSAWSTAYKVIDFAGGGSIGRMAGGNTISLSTNGYRDSSFVWRYTASDFAAEYNQASGQHRWYTAPSGTAGNAITFTQAMTLDASGRLGIGTTSPATALTVSGASAEARIIATGTDAGLGLYSASSGSANIRNWDIRSNTVGFGDFVIRTGSTLGGTPDTVRLRITSTGNVGIGTSNPISMLHVSPGGAVNQVAALFTTGASDGQFRAGFANGAGGAVNTEQAKIGMWYGTTVAPVCHIGMLRGGSTNSNGITFNVNNTERMRINSDGAVTGMLLGNYRERVYSIGAVSGTLALDAADGPIQNITLTGDITLNAFANPAAGQSMTIIVYTNGTGRTLSSNWRWAGGEKTLSTTDTIDIITVFYDGLYYWASLTKDYR
jgi:hypothetical protein